MSLETELLKRGIGLVTGEDVDVNADTSTMNDEQKRAVEQARIMLNIRRKLRFIAIGIFLLYCIPTFLYYLILDFSGVMSQPIMTILAIGFLGGILSVTFYVVGWFFGIFLFSSVGLRVYLYLRDLFTSKGTRL